MRIKWRVGYRSVFVLNVPGPDTAGWEIKNHIATKYIIFMIYSGLNEEKKIGAELRFLFYSAS
jgi:hypothetical protein